eukprot:188899_1
MTECFNQQCNILCISGYIREASVTCNLMIPSVIGTLCCNYLDSSITLSFDYPRISTIFKNQQLLGHIHPIQLFMILNSYDNNKDLLIQDLCTAISETNTNKLSFSQKLLNELRYNSEQRHVFYDILLHQTEFIHLTDLNTTQILNILKPIIVKINSQFDAVKLSQIAFDNQLDGNKFITLSEESFSKLFSSKLDVILIQLDPFKFPISRSKWIPDRATKVCMLCELKFRSGIFKSGKHHCRKCAIVICQSCVNKLNEHIVCTECYEKFKKQNDECWRNVYKLEIKKWRMQYAAVWLYKKGKWTDEWVFRYCVLTRSYPDVVVLRCYMELGGKETACIYFKNMKGCRKVKFEFFEFGFEIITRTRIYKFASDSKHDRDMFLNKMVLFGININWNRTSLWRNWLIRKHNVETQCKETESVSTSEELSDLEF